MQKSTYYNLNLVEGTDVYNPLVNDVPNYETIDQAMHDNAVAGVTVATELASGNVHAITRNNPECSVIRFVATSDWKSNDRMTIDGTEVTVRMLDGTVLKNNAYLINSNVLGILTGTVFTVYAEPFVPESASDIRFNDEENVHDAIIKDREDIALLNSNFKKVLEWHRINNQAVTDSVSVSIPSWANEVQVSIDINNEFRYTSIYPITSLTDESFICVVGSSFYKYGSKEEISYASVNISKKSVNMRNVILNGVQVKDTSFMVIYCR